MKPPDLEVVFGKPKGGPPTAGMDEESPSEDMDEGDDAEASEAEDAAIDEIFASKDPEARREAFKNAVRLCKESSY